jgi:hypothetical protein
MTSVRQNYIKKGPRSGSVADEFIISDPFMKNRSPSSQESKRISLGHTHTRSEILLKDGLHGSVSSETNIEEFDARKISGERVTRKMRQQMKQSQNLNELSQFLTNYTSNQNKISPMKPTLIKKCVQPKPASALKQYKTNVKDSQPELI